MNSYQSDTTMSKTMQVEKHGSSPTLNTILMVEETLKNMDESLITVAGLKKILPRQVNHNTLIMILSYLQNIGRVYMSVKGITYVGVNSPKMRKLLENSVEH